MYMDKEQTHYQASQQVQVVDTTAAGDTFTGYFVTGLLEGKTIPEVLRLATTAAGISVSRKGAAPSIPYRSEVRESL